MMNSSMLRACNMLSNREYEKIYIAGAHSRARTLKAYLNYLYPEIEVKAFLVDDLSENPEKADDSRYIHRGAMHWELAENSANLHTVEGKIFSGLAKLSKIRKTERVFVCGAEVRTKDLGDASLLCIVRAFEGEKVIGYFNFSEFEKSVSFEEETDYLDLISEKEIHLGTALQLPGYGFCYLKKKG